jgi:hypothetical protein
MKSLSVLIVALAVILLVCPRGVAFAQSSQESYTVTLNAFTLHVTFPSEVMPGDVFNVSVQGTPTGTPVYLQNLTATIYYADSSGLHQVATQVLVSNPANSYGYYGSSPTGSFSKSFTVTVPRDAPRTSLVTLFSEATQYSNYPYYSSYEPYPFSYWYFGDPLFYSYYPSFTATTDQAISPLSYIRATTPEYVALQAEYRMLQQQLNQTQTENQQLQTTLTQQGVKIDQLTQQLAAANTTAQTYEVAASVLAIIAIALAAFNIYQMKNKTKKNDAKGTTESE